MKNTLFLILILFISINAKSQNNNSIKRNPDSRKDYANLFFDPNYTLFDLWSDEPIFPNSNGIYNIYYATNEDKSPINFVGSASDMQSKVFGFKFKNKENLIKWAELGHPYLWEQKSNPLSANTTQNKNKVTNCTYSIVLPKIQWKYIDNRKLCKYCRARYAEYEKADIEEQKNTNTARLMQIKMDNHLKSIGADDEHIKSDNERLISFMKKNGLYNLISGSNMLMQKAMSLLYNAFGANPESDINQITIYSNNSEFCSLKCQDEYRRYRN